MLMYYVMTTMWRALNQRGLRRVYAQSFIKLSEPIFGLPMFQHGEKFYARSHEE